MASAAVSGYTPYELRKLLLNTDFEDFLDGNGFGRKGWNILKHKGIYKGDAFYEFMKEILKRKGVVTFGDLIDEKEKDNPKFRYRLKVYAADIVNERLAAWPCDATFYGQRPEYLEVAWAVRSSMSIPGFFRPAYHKHSKTYFVDGGILSNFPIWTFDSAGPPEWPTFGILLEEDKVKKNPIGRWPYNFLFAIFNTMMNAHDKRSLAGNDYLYRTIRVPVGDAGMVEFDMSDAKKEKLYQSGLEATQKFFETWRWSDYYNWCCKQRGIK